MTFQQFLALALTGPGTGVIIALLFQYVPFLQVWANRLSYEALRLAIFGLCLAVPLLATAAEVVFYGAVSTPDIWWSAVFVGCSGIATSQVTHLLVRDPHD